MLWRVGRTLLHSLTKELHIAKQQPTHEVRLGSIKAAIWENQTDNGTGYNVTLARIYKNGEQ